MESYSVKAILSASDQGFSREMSQFSQGLENIESRGKSAGISVLDFAKGAGAFKVVSVAANVLKNSLGDAIQRFDTLNQYPKVMQQLGFSAEESDKSIQTLSDGIQGLPTSLDSIASSTQSIALLTGDLDKATKTSLALNDAFLASGSASADAERGLVQYTQMLSKGTVDMQSWRTLQETMGPALTSVAKAFGFAGQSAQNDLYAALRDGEITFDQFNSKLIELDQGVDGFAERAKTASTGLGTSFTNLGTAVVRGLEGVIRTADESLSNAGLPNFQQMVGIVTAKVNSAFQLMSVGVGGAVETFGNAIAFAQNHMTELTFIAVTAGGAFLAYKTAVAASAKVEKWVSSAQKVKKQLSEMKRYTELKTTADKLSTKATEASRVAELWREKATVAATAATKKKTAAKLAEEKAEKAMTLAADAGGKSEELNTAAEVAGTAATKAKREANTAAAKAAKVKAVASNADAKATALNTKAEAANTVANAANVNALATGGVAATAKAAAMGVLSGQIGVATAAQMVWNAALAANPIGVVIAAVAGLIGIIGGLVIVTRKLIGGEDEKAKAQKKAIEGYKETAKSAKEAHEAAEEATSGIKNEVEANEELLRTLTSVSGKENKSANDKAELQGCVDSLNNAISDLNLEYDEESDHLSQSIDLIKKRVEASNAQKIAANAEEQYNAAIVSRKKLEMDLQDIAEKKAEIQAEVNKQITDAAYAQTEYNNRVAELVDQEKSLQEQKKTAMDDEEKYKAIVTESAAQRAQAEKAAQEAQREALAESIANHTVTLEELKSYNEEAAKVVEDMKGVWQSYVDHTTDMFDTLSDKSEMSVEQMADNLLENQRVVGEWADNIALLAEHGIDDGLLNQLREAGPESAGYVKAMVEDMTETGGEQLNRLSEAFAKGGDTATTAFKIAFDIGGGEVQDSIMNLVTQPAATLREQIVAADFPGIGKQVVTGYAQGMADTAEVDAAVTNMVQNGVTAAEAAQESGSPSQAYARIAGDAIDGYVLGLQEKGEAISTALQNVITEGINAAKDSSNMANLADAVSFDGIVIKAQSSMTKTQSAITSGMSSVENTLRTKTESGNNIVKNSLNKIQSTVQEKIRQIQRSVTSGIDQMNRAIDSGMGKARNSVSNGVNQIVATANTLQAKLYSSGYNGALGLARGLDSGSGSVAAAAARLANRIITTIDSTLHNGSPSKVERQAGRYAGEGLALGLLDRVRMVKGAADQLAVAALPTGHIARSLAAFGGYHMRTELAYAGEVGAAYTIVVPVELDGREIAKVTAPYTRAELDTYEVRDRRSRGYR